MFFYEKNTLRVGDFQKIIMIKEKEIDFLLCNNNKLIVSGESLSISFYDKTEVLINGIIKRVEINDQ